MAWLKIPVIRLPSSAEARRLVTWHARRSACTSLPLRLLGYAATTAAICRAARASPLACALLMSCTQKLCGRVC